MACSYRGLWVSLCLAGLRPHSADATHGGTETGAGSEVLPSGLYSKNASVTDAPATSSEIQTDTPGAQKTAGTSAAPSEAAQTVDVQMTPFANEQKPASTEPTPSIHDADRATT